MSVGANDEAGGVTGETGVSHFKGVEGTGGGVWRSRREESDRVVFFGGRRMRFLLSSLCLLSSLYFLFFAAAIAFGDSLSKWYWNVPTSSEANSSGPLQAARRGVSDAEQSPRATVEAGVASEQFLPGTQALRLENSTAEAGAGSERLGNRVEAAPPSPEALPAATTAVQFPVASELFDKAGRPSLPDTEARPSANAAARGKREEPLPEAPPAPNATRPDDPSSKQSASKVEDPSAPDAVAASPPIAMVQEGASSERVTSGEPIASRTAAVPSA